MSMTENPEFVEALDQHFPGAVLEGEFVAETAVRLVRRDSRTPTPSHVWRFAATK